MHSLPPIVVCTNASIEKREFKRVDVLQDTTRWKGVTTDLHQLQLQSVSNHTTQGTEDEMK